jgi:hypothetical protein
VQPGPLLLGQLRPGGDTLLGTGAPERPGADRVTREAHSHEVSSCGFWPGSGPVQEAAFYAYAVPQPEGLARAAIRPASAWYGAELGEFLLRYDDVRTATHGRPALWRVVPYGGIGRAATAIRHPRRRLGAGYCLFEGGSL